MEKAEYGKLHVELTPVIISFDKIDVKESSGTEFMQSVICNSKSGPMVHLIPQQSSTIPYNFLERSAGSCFHTVRVLSIIASTKIMVPISEKIVSKTYSVYIETILNIHFKGE